MEETIRVLNAMQKNGLYERYAIGGAIAALFYLEPFETHDLDIFVALPGPTPAILSLEPIYRFLRAQGYREQGEEVLIAGVPVQFLVATSPLVEEAIGHAITTTYGSQTTYVFSPEYLMAIMVELGRPKDCIRLGLFLDQATFDQKALHEILQHHKLVGKWYKTCKILGYEGS